jgi:hypothetical protein
MHFTELQAALEAAERSARELADNRPPRAGERRLRRGHPGAQVVGRVELSGPQPLLPDVVVGLDVRGDGSLQAYRGRLRRRAIEPQEGESATEALRRELSGAR